MNSIFAKCSANVSTVKLFGCFCIEKSTKVVDSFYTVFCGAEITKSETKTVFLSSTLKEKSKDIKTKKTLGKWSSSEKQSFGLHLSWCVRVGALEKAEKINFLLLSESPPPAAEQTTNAKEQASICKYFTVKYHFDVCVYACTMHDGVINKFAIFLMSIGKY